MGVRKGLLAQTQSLDDGAVALNVTRLQIVEQATTLTYEACERTLGAVVLAVLLHVLGEVSDATGEQGNLALCATGVGGTLAILLENLNFLS